MAMLESNLLDDIAQDLEEENALKRVKIRRRIAIVSFAMIVGWCVLSMIFFTSTRTPMVFVRIFVPLLIAIISQVIQHQYRYRKAAS